MEETSKNDIRLISTKIGLLNLIAYFGMFLSYIYIYNLLNGDLNNSLKLIIILTFPLHLSLFITTIFIFKLNIKDMFWGKATSFNISVKSKIKLTLFFTSIYLFASIISTYIMNYYISSKVLEIPSYIGDNKESVYTLIYIGIIVPIIEEIIFRGIILRELKVGGSLFAIIISSLVFTIPHSVGLLHAFIGGLIMGFCYILTGNIRWSIIFHIVCNFVIVAILEWFEVLLPFVNLNIVRLTMGVILVSIFFVAIKKDDELKAFFKLVNFNTVINQLKIDKEKYRIFITSPSIIIFIVFGILRFMFALI